MKQKVAICLLWQKGAEANPQRALEYSEILPRVFVVDARTPGEAFGSLAHPRLHYAPFRQHVSLGCALNRALRLAYEEGYEWLWAMDGRLVIRQEQLQTWSQRASQSTGLYVTDATETSPKLLRRPFCGFLVSVELARSLGGWDPALPAQLVFPDFYARFKATGRQAELGIPVQQQPSGLGFDPWGRGPQSLVLDRKAFFYVGDKKPLMMSLASAIVGDL